MTKEEVFTTADIGLAGALSTLGHQLVKTEKQERSVVFFFTKSEQLAFDARQYYTGNLKVDAFSHGIELRKMRKIVGAYYRAEEGVQPVREATIDKPEDIVLGVKKKRGRPPKPKKDKDGFSRV